MESLELKEIYNAEFQHQSKTVNQDRLYASLVEFAKGLNFPEITINIEPVKLSGGMLGFGQKEDMSIVIKCTFNKMKKLRAFIRAQNFGNVCQISYYSTTSAGLFDRLTSKTSEERLEAIKEKLTDVALVEYFEAFNSFIDFIQAQALDLIK